MQVRVSFLTLSWYNQSRLNSTFNAGANLTNAVLDRVDFTRANLKNSNFRNAVITGSVFKDADLTGATFEEALIGGEDAKRL